MEEFKITRQAWLEYQNNIETKIKELQQEVKELKESAIKNNKETKVGFMVLNKETGAAVEYVSRSKVDK